VLAQATDYYPFGKSFEHVNVAQNRYLYNGKELQDQAIGGTPFGWYDYGARFYDPELGIFHTVDPLAERFSFQSPFAYAANNPILYIDKNGENPALLRQLTQISQQFNRILVPILISAGIITVVHKKTVPIVNDVVTRKSSDKASSDTKEAYKRQRNQDKKAKDKLDKNQANVAESIDKNYPKGDPSGDREPNRFDKTGAVILTGTTMAKVAADAITNPDPTQDAQDVKKEQYNQGGASQSGNSNTGNTQSTTTQSNNSQNTNNNTVVEDDKKKK